MCPFKRHGWPRSRKDGQVRSQPSSSRSVEIQRRVRGRRRLESFWNRNTNEPKKRVESNSRGQPIGYGGRDLGRFLGTMIRRPKFFSFRYSDWRHVPQEEKEKVWQKIQDVFEIDVTLKDWVLESFNKKWKDYKAHLKQKNYNPFKGDIIGAKRNRPSDLDEREWDWLVEFWESDTGKMREERGKVNRGKHSMPHTSGTKSFARVFHEEKINNNGKEPSRLEMFCKLHKRKDGTFVNSATKEKISQMNALMSKQPEDSQSDMFKEEIFSQVMGKDGHGRCRLYGLGVSPTDLYGPNPKRKELLKEIEHLRCVIADMKSNMATMEERFNVLVSAFCQHFGTQEPQSLTMLDRLIQPQMEITKSLSDQDGVTNSHIASDGSC